MEVYCLLLMKVTSVYLRLQIFHWFVRLNLLLHLVGEADLISLISNRVIHKYRFNDTVLHLSFSPDGKHIAACKLNKGK